MIEFFNTDFHKIHYLTTYCVYYTKECYNFINEVEQICFNENVIKDYKKFLPLGDETVFNYLYSKYNFDKFISSYLCYDVNPFLSISHAKSNLEKVKNFVSFIHIKRYISDNPHGKDFSRVNIDEYKQIFEILLSKETCESKINIISVQKNTNDDIIFFNLVDNYDGPYCITLVSLFRPSEEHIFLLNLCDNVTFFLSKKKDIWIKDTHFIIKQSEIIKDSIKII